MSRQFPVVNCQYGAPMGRVTIPISAEDKGYKSLHLFKVVIDSQGYDDGGVYWGNSYSSLYCARNLEVQEFVRAYSREHAAALLDLCNADLARPLNSQKVRDLFMSWTNNRLPPQWEEVEYLGLWFEKFGHRWING